MQDWDSLRIVLAIAREGSLSGAARSLGLTHATLSRQLDKAEAASGRRLFSRRPTGLVPTEAGREVVTRASAIEAEILALELALAAHDEGETGPLTVTLAPLVAASGVAEDIRAFAEAHPGIRLTVLAGNEVLDIHRREADVAIRVSHEPAESLWGRVVARQRAGWFATRDFIDRHADALANGGAVPILRFSSWASPVPKSLLDRMPKARPAMICDDMLTALALAQVGLAMLRMPCFLALSHPDLCRVPNLPLTDYMPIWCLTHPDLRQVARVSVFMRFIAEGFARRRALYLGPD